MERKILNYFEKIDSLKKGNWECPVCLEIDPSSACNLKCFFCTDKVYLKENSEFLNFNLYRSLIEEAKELGVKAITFTGGGEPLLHPQFNQMARFAIYNGFEIGLITNGLLLNTISDPEIFKFIRISLDAYDEKSYKKIKGKNCFNQVVSNIISLAEKEITDVGISYVVCDENIFGIEIVRNIFKDTKGIDYIQFKPVWIDGKIPRNIRKNLNILEDKALITERYSNSDSLSCIIAGLIGVIGANGKVYYCCQHRGEEKFFLGDLKINSFYEIWKNRKDLVVNTTKCPICRYRNYAAGYRKFSNPKYKFLKHRNFL
jgi:radical SAM protein with 4Fe4S-binding SPASM domain